MQKRLTGKIIAIGLIVLCTIGIAGTSVSWMGTTYTIPSTGETDWSGPTKVDGFLTSVASNALSKAGGNFTLTADANFGASFGLLAPYFSARTNAASAGFLRLDNGGSISWRNAANSANLHLNVNNSNELVFNGTTLVNSSGVLPVASGGTGLASYTAGDTLYASGSTTLSKLAIGTSGLVYVANTSAPVWQKITDAQVQDGAAISRAKLASGTADHVVINSAAGAVSSEAQLAVSRGGTNISSYTTGDIVYASGSGTLSKLGIGTTGQKLTVSGGGLPTWGAASAASAGSSISAAYTITANDDIIFADASGSSLVLTLPSAAANAGKVYKIKKIDTVSGTTVDIRRAGADSILWNIANTSAFLKTFNESIELFSDGISQWKVLARGLRTPTIQRFSSGSGTYTTPTERVPTYIKVKMIGAGGEGGPDGTGGGSGSSGGQTTFGTSLLTAAGGAGASNQAGAAGGTCTVNSPATSVVTVTGGSGSGGGLSNGSNNAAAGGAGGNGFFGGGGAGGSSANSGGSAGATNSGAGGGGEWSPNNPNTEAGGGGGAGCYIEAIIENPSTSYSYAVGAGGTGASGADGGSGVIIVEEYYN